MKNYLSFGAGVNSVALYLLMRDMGIEFEAVYVDHGADWPETLEYVEMFRQKYPLTVIHPEYQGHKTLLGFCQSNRMTPNIHQRWCTQRFKVEPFSAYIKRPCFIHIGIDAGEQHRARMSGEAGQENRYILIEEDIDRAGCEQIIKAHGLPVPPKSGCFFCPFQRVSQWKSLRRRHPDLFCVVQQLEASQNKAREEKGKGPFWIRDRPLGELVNDRQMALPGLEADEYPPCQCGL